MLRNRRKRVTCVISRRPFPDRFYPRFLSSLSHARFIFPGCVHVLPSSARMLVETRSRTNGIVNLLHRLFRRDSDHRCAGTLGLQGLVRCVSSFPPCLPHPLSRNFFHDISDPFVPFRRHESPKMVQGGRWMGAPRG